MTMVFIFIVFCIGYLFGGMLTACYFVVIPVLLFFGFCVFVSILGAIFNVINAIFERDEK